MLENNNYIVVQSFQKLTILEIRDLTNPIIVDVVNDISISSTYQISVHSQYLALPVFEIFNLYYQKTSFYYTLTATTYLGSKIFTCKFYPADPISLDKSSVVTSLLNVQTDDTWPYWITVNLDDSSLTITPPECQNLEALRDLILTYSTQIAFSEFYEVSAGKTSDEVYTVLLNSGIINVNNMILPGYDPNVILQLPSDFNLTNITLLLNSHYLQTHVNFILQDFIDLDNAPIIGVKSLQYQFDLYGAPQINNLINFVFDPSSFIDPDGDTLTYSATNLPTWLEFYPNSQKFLGTPTKYDLGVYTIVVNSSDGYKNISDNLIISVAKQPPIAFSQNNQNLTLGLSYDFSLPTTNFIDPNNDPLTYASYIINNGTLEKMPNWLNFDNSRLRLYGNPQASDINYDNVNTRFYQEFFVDMVATDIADQTAHVQFILTVINYSPRVNPNQTLNEQFDKLGDYIKVSQVIDFQFTSDTFIDPDNTDLFYTATGTPGLLTFSLMRFYGSASKNDIGIYNITVFCSDGLSNVSDYFIISIENHSPVAQPLENQTMILGQKYSYFLPSDTFSNPEDCTLLYNVYLINDNGTEESLPSWLTFDGTRQLFNGDPSTSDINFDSINKCYYQEFNIEVTVTDLAGIVVSSNFTLTIQNHAPVAKSLPNATFVLGKSVSYTIQSDTFTDQDNDTLTYQAFILNETNELTNLPNWLTF